MALCAHALNDEDCIPDCLISAERMRIAEQDLVKLGCCRRSDDNKVRLTALGAECATHGDLNVQCRVFLWIAAAIGVGDHARIVMAYLETESSNIELFQNYLPGKKGPGPLLPSQIALGVENSDLVTALRSTSLF